MSESLAEFARPLGRRERIELADTPVYAEALSASRATVLGADPMEFSLADQDAGIWDAAQRTGPKPKRLAEKTHWFIDQSTGEKRAGRTAVRITPKGIDDIHARVEGQTVLEVSA